MRLSIALNNWRGVSGLYKQKINWPYWQRKLWDRQSELNVAPLQLPDAWKDKQFVDVAEQQQAQEKTPYLHFDFQPQHPKLVQPIDESSPQHPLWQNGRTAWCFNENLQLCEGLEQAQSLSRTVIYRHAPASFERRLTQSQSDPETNDAVRRAILQSVRFDACEDRLPRRNSLRRPNWRFPTYYGISYWRAARTLFDDLLRLAEGQLCERGGGEQLLQRRVLRDVKVRVPIERSDGERILFEPELSGLIMSPDAMEQFDSEYATTTADATLPELYPLRDIIDLVEKQSYVWNDYCLVKGRSLDHLHPHTILLEHHGQWDPWTTQWSLDQKHAKALLTCFAVATAHARRLYGAEVDALPKPIAVQCILSDRGSHFTFYSYQLNSLSPSADASLCNQCWIDSQWIEHERDIPEWQAASYADEEPIPPTEQQYELFTVAPTLESLQGYQRYGEHHSETRYPNRRLRTYDDAIYPRFLAAYASGLALSPPLQQQLDDAAPPQEETVAA